MRLHVQSSGQPNNLMLSEVLCLTIVIQTDSVAINACVRCIPFRFTCLHLQRRIIKKQHLDVSWNILLGTGRPLNTTPPEARLCVDLAHIHPKASCCRKYCAISHTHNSLPTFSCPDAQTNHHSANRCESSQRGSSCGSDRRQSKRDCTPGRCCTPMRAFSALVCPSSILPRGPDSAR